MDRGKFTSGRTGMEQEKHLESEDLGFRFLFCHLIAVEYWQITLSLILSFLICKIGTLLCHSLCEVTMNNSMKNS